MALDEPAIADLVRETAASYEVVKVLYEQEFAALRAGAKVETFLGILASRRVKQRLRGKPGVAQAAQRSVARVASMGVRLAQREEVRRVLVTPGEVSRAAQGVAGTA